MQDSKLEILMQYVARGWALVPLHDVSAGYCSCLAGPNCGGSAGKHPRYGKWQEDGQLIRDPAVLAAVHDAHPEWNWGVATGAVSGMWVLDWDPGSAGIDGHAFLERLVAECSTLVLGPTGGGGHHYIFAMPPDFEVHGSQTRNRYGLPPGLDVRGWHGQIVVAPSESGKGPYGGVLVAAPVQRAPSWLEDALRPQPGDNPVNRGALGSASAVQVTLGDPRALAYAAATVREVLSELESAPTGTRNDTAFRTGCRLVEIGNAPWTGFTLEVLEGAWWAAGSAHPDGAYVPAAELAGVWRRACATVGAAAAYLPAGVAGGEHIPILDFPQAPPRTALPDGSSPGQGLPMLDAGGVAGGLEPVIDPVTALIDRMLTPEQIRALPKPRPLIQGLLDLNTTTWLIGRPKSTKSFVALDMAAHVGLGLSWQGRRVHQGRVVYIVAEGSQGIGLRLEAWEREYGQMKDLLVLAEPVKANERVGKFGQTAPGAWTVLVEACRRLAPVMVIIDTQARVTGGLRENDNDDMSYYAEQADRIKEASGACVLTVHHIGRSGSDARGASAIDGAQDGELRVERAGDDAMLIKIHVDAQKDMAAEKPLTIALKRSDGGMSPEGRDLSSLVLVRPVEGAELALQDPAGALREERWRTHMRLLYQVIFDQFNGGSARGGMGGAYGEIRSAYLAVPEMVNLAPNLETRKRYFRNSWNGSDGNAGLVARGLIARPIQGDKVFKIVVIEDQSSEGVLTPNDPKNWTEATDGWLVFTPADGAPE